jgi:hypothetical protein
MPVKISLCANTFHVKRMRRGRARLAENKYSYHDDHYQGHEGQPSR